MGEIIEVGGALLKTCSEYADGGCKHLAMGLRDYKSWGYYADFCRHGEVVADLGAHIGDTAVVLAKLVGPTGHVHSFEPEPIHYQLLVENLITGPHRDRNNAYQNVTCHEQAAAEKTEPYWFYAGCGGSSRFQQSPATFEAQGIALDECLDHLDGLKMDTQGGEDRILRGMPRLLEKLRWAIIEYHFDDNYVQVMLDAGFQHKQATPQNRFDAFWK